MSKNPFSDDLTESWLNLGKWEGNIHEKTNWKTQRKEEKMSGNLCAKRARDGEGKDGPRRKNKQEMEHQIWIFMAMNQFMKCFSTISTCCRRQSFHRGLLRVLLTVVVICCAFFDDVLTKQMRKFWKFQIDQPMGQWGGGGRDQQRWKKSLQNYFIFSKNF